MAAPSQKALRNFPPRATSCCRAFPAMTDVYMGPEGAFANALRGALLIDMSFPPPSRGR